jgi:hypothetical protein
MAKKISLEEAVRSLLAPKEQKMNISGRTDSNLSHNIEEDEQIDEIRGAATTTLGGEGLKRRMGLQRSGNQKRRVYEEATKIALKKVTEKKLDDFKSVFSLKPELLELPNNIDTLPIKKLKEIVKKMGLFRVC